MVLTILSRTDAITDSVVRGVPYVLLLLLVLASSLYQQRQIQVRSSGQEKENNRWG